MDTDSTSLILGLIFGSIGVGYCIYGKKQHHLVAFVAGLLLCGLPYLITNTGMLSVVSLVIMLSPRFIKL